MTDEREEAKDDQGNSPIETFYSERGLPEFVVFLDGTQREVDSRRWLVSKVRKMVFLLKLL